MLYSNSSALSESSLEFWREPSFHKDPEEVGNPVFLDSIKISSPNPELDHCSCVSVQLFQWVLKSNWNLNVWTSIWIALSEKSGELLQEINLSAD